MKKFIFIFGGVRSGKSQYAVDLAKTSNQDVVFIATASAGDDEMKQRIEAHKKSRPAHWKLVEEELDVERIIKNVGKKNNFILIDCLGLLITNLLMIKMSDRNIIKKVKDVCAAIRKTDSNVILISNDVGSGLVPDNPLARRFRDLMGLANQVMAKNANDVVFLQVGIPMILKTEKEIK